MIVLHLLLAVCGLVGTWYFNIASIAAGEDYIGAGSPAPRRRQRRSFAIALAFTFPLFLAWRERRHRGSERNTT